MTPQTLATEWHLLSSSHALLVQEALWQPLMFYQESPFGLQALGRKISIHNTSRIRCRYPSPFNSCKWLCEPWAHRLPLRRWLVSVCCSFTLISVQDHFFWSNGHLNEVEQKQFLFPRIQIKFPERESPKDIWICLYPFPLRINFWGGLRQGRRPPLHHTHPTGWRRDSPPYNRTCRNPAPQILLFFTLTTVSDIICVNLWSTFGNSHLSSN